MQPEHIQCEIAAFLKDFPLIDEKFVLLDKIGEGSLSLSLSSLLHSSTPPLFTPPLLTPSSLHFTD